MRNNTDMLFAINMLKSKNKRHGPLLGKKQTKKKQDCLKGGLHVTFGHLYLVT